MNPETKSKTLELLGRLVGGWTTEATHPSVPGLVVRGTVAIEWLEGRQFLIHRARTEHPEFPDSVSIIGFTERDRLGEAAGEPEPQLTMHYFDSRGVFRVYEAAFDEKQWRIWRDSPGFSQRFTGTFDAAGAAVVGVWQLREDNREWKEDLRITYRRSK